MRVLIVEDEDNLRHMMRLALEAEHVVGEADSGETGLERFGNGSDWDVVLLDQRLPGIDGLETLRRIRDRDPSAGVVMITAFASVELAVDAMKLGARDFLRKPVSPESLRGALAAALRMKAERPFVREPSGVRGAKPGITHLTLNGFQIVREEDATTPTDSCDHVFTVVEFASGARHRVTVHVDREEVDRVARLSGQNLEPQGAFWRGQAEAFLANSLWFEGRVPRNGRLVLTDLSRDTIDVAVAWKGD